MIWKIPPGNCVGVWPLFEDCDPSRFRFLKKRFISCLSFSVLFPSLAAELKLLHLILIGYLREVQVLLKKEMVFLS